MIFRILCILALSVNFFLSISISNMKTRDYSSPARFIRGKCKRYGYMRFMALAAILCLIYGVRNLAGPEALSRYQTEIVLFSVLQLVVVVVAIITRVKLTSFLNRNIPIESIMK